MRGHTLIELLFVLLLAGLTVASLAPLGRRYRDRESVVAAREAVVGLLGEARLAAVERGAGSVRIAPNPWHAVALAGDSIVRAVPLEAAFGVDMSFAGTSDSIEVGYDALGLGRVASQTLVFMRGNESARLVISSFGRVTRR
jgi:Tfp pilus assembly protein FimT